MNHILFMIFATTIVILSCYIIRISYKREARNVIFLRGTLVNRTLVSVSSYSQIKKYIYLG